MIIHIKKQTFHSLRATIFVLFSASTKRLMTLALLASLFCAGTAQAQSSGAWSVNADGNWSLSSNWKSSIVATGTTGVAYFTNAITASRTVNLDSSPWTINGLTFTNTGVFGWAITNGTLNLAGTTPGFTVAPNSTATVQSAISGTAGLKMAGNGTLILSGNNTFTNGVTIGTGNTTLSKLVLGSSNALNSTPGSENAVTLNCDFTCGLFLNGYSVTISSLSGDQNRWVRNNSSIAATLTVGNNSNLDSLYLGSIADGTSSAALTLVKMGTGAMSITYGYFSGGLFIKAGTVQNSTRTDNTTTFGTGAITLGDNTVGQNATMKLSQGGQTLTNSITIASGAGTRTILATHATAVTTLSGTIVMNTNLTLQTTDNVTSPTLVVSGSLSGTGNLTLNDATTTGGITLSGTNTYTGSTTILAGRVTIGGTGKLGNGDYTSVISNSGTLIYNSTAAQTVGGISGSGPVVISAGMFGCTNTISCPVSVTAAGVLAPSLGLGGSNTLTLSSTAANALTLNGGPDLKFALSSIGTNDQIKIAGTLVLNGANYIALSFPEGSAPIGTYTLMTYASKTGTGTLALNGSYPNAILTVGDTSVTLIVSGSGTSGSSVLTWKGNVNGIWNTSSLNWTNGSAAVVYNEGNAVTFDDATSVKTVSGTAQPGSTTFNNTVDYTISAAIGGTGYLLKNGSAKVFLSGINSYTGPTVINAGTLTISTAGQLGNGSYSGEIMNNGTLIYDSSAAQTLSGGITGTGSVTGSGSGTLTLTGTNSYSGGTAIYGGSTLVIAGSGAITGSGNLTLGVTTTIGTCRYYSSATSTFGVIALGNGGNVGSDYLIQTNGTIIGNSLTLGVRSASPVYGTLHISGGTMTISGLSYLDVSSATVNIPTNSITISDTGAFNANGGLCLSAYSSTVRPCNNKVIQNGGTVTVAGATGLQLLNAGASNTVAPRLAEYALNGGTLSVNLIANGSISASDGVGTFIFNGGTLKPTGSSTTFWANNTRTTASITNGGAVVDTAGFDITIAQSLVQATGATTANLTKLGAGTLTLSGTNTYTGTTMINTGILRTTLTNSLSAASSVAIASGGANLFLNFNGTNTVKALKLDNKTMASGVYGVGKKEPTYFSGNGALNVLTGSSGGTMVRFF